MTLNIADAECLLIARFGEAATTPADFVTGRAFLNALLQEALSSNAEAG